MHPALQPSQSPYFPHSQPCSDALRLSGYLSCPGCTGEGGSGQHWRARSTVVRTVPASRSTQDSWRGPVQSCLLKVPALCQRCGSLENRNCRTRKAKKERTLCQERSGKQFTGSGPALIYCVISRKSLPLSVPLYCMMDQAALKSY